MDQTDLDRLLERHDERMIRLGSRSAAEELLRGELGDEVAELVIGAHRERMGPLVPAPLATTPRPAEPVEPGEWNPHPDFQSPRWQYAKSQLKLPPPAIEETDAVTTEILRLIGDPKRKSITTRGLVLGYVQSGKTTNYLSLAAKAADNGYDLIVILSGVHNSLRRQTQNRAERALLHQRHLWWLGTPLKDFHGDGNPVSTHLAGDGKRGLLVVKKHPRVLEKLAEYLESGVPDQFAALIIDDEADQAGLDVADGPVREGVHRQLYRIINLEKPDGSKRCAYVGYTATPYANILTTQDESGLYPKDFIYPLHKPDGYVGSEELFGDSRVGNPIRIERDISDDILTAGLRDAIRWFVVATAARAALEGSPEMFHSTMLIHTTQKKAVHQTYRPVIESYLKYLVQDLAANESTMQEFYLEGLQQVPASADGTDDSINEAAAPWDGVREHLPAVLDRLINGTPSGDEFEEDGQVQQAHSGVIVDNSAVPWRDRLTYSDLEVGESGVTVIAIGGNTLSRGLTLEGLVCSYFARASKTYDTLMQMGRWFGYRRGYRHLVRVWTTQELFDWYQELNKVEQELRDELLWMRERGFKPHEYGPRILQSPFLNITRQAAMRSVVRHVSYSDSRVELAWLNLDLTALQTNQQLVRDLAIGLGDAESSDRSVLFRGVPLERVMQFVRDFQYHEQERRLDPPSFERYVEAEQANLSSWNVLFRSQQKGPSTFEHGGDVGTVQTVVRSRQKEATPAYIGSLVDSGDHRVDLGPLDPDSGVHYRAKGEPPLLIIYAIDPTSTPLAHRGDARAPLDAPTTPISLALVLPQSSVTLDYVAPDIGGPEEEPDFGDFET